MPRAPRTQKDFSTLLAGRRGAGTVPAGHAFPLHTQAADLGYGIFANGCLSVLFAIPPAAYFSATELAETLPPGSGLQYYRHFLPGVEAKTYLAVTAPVGYAYEFSPWKGFLNLFRPGFVTKQIRTMDEATEATYTAILNAIEEAFSPEAVYALEGFEPLLTVLGRSRAASTAHFNMAFLALPDQRLGLLADCQSVPARSNIPVPPPPEGLEALFCTCVSIPDGREAPALAEAHRARETFEKSMAVRKAGDKRSQVLEMAPTYTGPLPGMGILRHYFFLLSPNAQQLVLEGEAFFREAAAAGYPTHPSLIANRDQYCQLFPGNINALSDGLSVPLAQLDTLFERLCP